uniref:Secreted protein n=1 Tax=Oryza sativa subsp. japonica TaxID=39947 RepID=Q69JP4_ORYSJ|nr:hypothetical protein [Oryza sativa Japonica Group]
MSIFTPLFFLCIGPSCRPIVPGRPNMPVEGPRHGPVVGPGRHGPDLCRAVPCLGRAKIPCHGPSRRASGLLAIYRRGEAGQATSPLCFGHCLQFNLPTMLASITSRSTPDRFLMRTRVSSFH